MNCNESWGIDWGCYGDPGEVDAIDPAQKSLAGDLAVSALRSLTLGQVGGCPITVRPCLPCKPRDISEPWMFPYHGPDGVWRNSGNWDMGCRTPYEVHLDGPVGRVDEVIIDGVVLDPTAYRLDDENILVRLDGEVWPVAQDLTLALTEVGTFAITYLNAQEPDAMASYVAGLLAVEFLKACTGGACALPRNVVGITRQGVSIQLSTDVFPNGRTGIDVVDAWLHGWNPYTVRTPSVIGSIDAPRARRVSW